MSDVWAPSGDIQLGEAGPALGLPMEKAYSVPVVIGTAIAMLRDNPKLTMAAGLA